MGGKLKKAIFWPLTGIVIIGLFFPLFLAGQTDELPDPFYDNLLEEGKFFCQNGKPVEAIENLEIAFFGFLDSPAKLAESYVYLTVCHFQLKNIEKCKYYAGEIKRLKLEEQIPLLNLRQDLAEKYEEIKARLDNPAGAAKAVKPAKRH